MDMWISRLVLFFRWHFARVDPRKSCHKNLPPSYEKAMGVSWRGDWFMGTDITDQIKSFKKTISS